MSLFDGNVSMQCLQFPALEVMNRPVFDYRVSDKLPENMQS